jgi:hypothetical protein
MESTVMNPLYIYFKTEGNAIKVPLGKITGMQLAVASDMGLSDRNILLKN